MSAPTAEHPGPRDHAGLCSSQAERLDLAKIDAESAEALFWKGMQERVQRFPAAAVAIELHLQRDPPQITSMLYVERNGDRLRYLDYEGESAVIDPATVVANPQEHGMLRAQKGLLRLHGGKLDGGLDNLSLHDTM